MAFFACFLLFGKLFNLLWNIFCYILVHCCTWPKYWTNNLAICLHWLRSIAIGRKKKDINMRRKREREREREREGSGLDNVIVKLGALLQQKILEFKENWIKFLYLNRHQSDVVIFYWFNWPSTMEGVPTYLTYSPLKCVFPSNNWPFPVSSISVFQIAGANCSMKIW